MAIYFLKFGSNLLVLLNAISAMRIKFLTSGCLYWKLQNSLKYFKQIFQKYYSVKIWNAPYFPLEFIKLQHQVPVIIPPLLTAEIFQTCFQIYIIVQNIASNSRTEKNGIQQFSIFFTKSKVIKTNNCHITS